MNNYAGKNNNNYSLAIRKAENITYVLAGRKYVQPAENITLHSTYSLAIRKADPPKNYVA
jgi:hypothetical protein